MLTEVSVPSARIQCYVPLWERINLLDRFEITRLSPRVSEFILMQCRPFSDDAQGPRGSRPANVASVSMLMRASASPYSA